MPPARQDLKSALVLMAPGCVRTDLGGPDARLTLEQSVPSLVNVLPSKDGTPVLQYVDYIGRTVPGQDSFVRAALGSPACR